jgi:biotin carboxyl carrier protein
VRETRASLGLAPPPRAADRPLLLLVGFARRDLDALREEFADRHQLLYTEGAEEAKRLLGGRRDIAVVCLGERCAGEEARRFIAQQPAPVPPGLEAPPPAPPTAGTPAEAAGDAASGFAREAPDFGPDAADFSPEAPLFLVLAAGPDPALFQELVAEDRIFYLTKSPPEPAALAALIDSALRLHRVRRKARAAAEQAAGSAGGAQIIARDADGAGGAQTIARAAGGAGGAQATAQTAGDAGGPQATAGSAAGNQAVAGSARGAHAAASADGLADHDDPRRAPGTARARHRPAFDTFELLRRMAIEPEPAGKAEILAEGAREAVDADRGYCLLYDPTDDSLWARDAAGTGERRESAAVGLASFALRSGLPVAVPRVGDDPRWDREADDPVGDGGERLLAVPARPPAGMEGIARLGAKKGREASRRGEGSARDMWEGGDRGDGRAASEWTEPSEAPPAAILIAVRQAAEPMFTEAERDTLERLAAAAAPYLPRPPASGDEEGEIFRREALEHYQHTDEQRDPLMLSPTWTRWSYWMLLSGLAAALVFSLLFEVHQYASGPAVVWMGGRTDVTALAAGTVRSVEVLAGQPVAAGQVLVRFDQAQEGAELARMEQEFELQLVKRLHDPADAAAEQALVSLNAQLQLARARVRERTVTAPAAGTVADVRVRPGQYLAPGQSLLAIVPAGEGSRAADAGPTGGAESAGPASRIPDAGLAGGAEGAGPASRAGQGAISSRTEAGPVVLVVLPGEYRPQLVRGMPIRFEISGYRYSYQRLALESVDDEIVGPNEARRYLGPDIADALTITGPVVIVRARLPGPSFKAEGKTYLYHNGMHGQAEVRVRSEKILVTLVPGLKPIFEKLHL